MALEAAAEVSGGASLGHRGRRVPQGALHSRGRGAARAGGVRAGEPGRADPREERVATPGRCTRVPALVAPRRRAARARSRAGARALPARDAASGVLRRGGEARLHVRAALHGRRDARSRATARRWGGCGCRTLTRSSERRSRAPRAVRRRPAGPDRRGHQPRPGDGTASCPRSCRRRPPRRVASPGGATFWSHATVEGSRRNASRARSPCSTTTDNVLLRVDGLCAKTLEAATADGSDASTSCIAATWEEKPRPTDGRRLVRARVRRRRGRARGRPPQRGAGLRRVLPATWSRPSSASRTPSSSARSSRSDGLLTSGVDVADRRTARRHAAAPDRARQWAASSTRWRARGDGGVLALRATPSVSVMAYRPPPIRWRSRGASASRVPAGRQRARRRRAVRARARRHPRGPA